MCPKAKWRPDEGIVEEKGSDVQPPRVKREKSRASDSIKNTADEGDISDSSDYGQPCNLDTRPSDAKSSDDLSSRSKPGEYQVAVTSVYSKEFFNFRIIRFGVSENGLCQPSIYEHGRNVLISCTNLLEEQTAVTVEKEQHEKVLEVLISCIVTASKWKAVER